MHGDATMQKITPCLWFNDQAEAAARFYTSIFKNATIGEITYYGEGSPRPKGSVLTVRFQLDEQEFLALNGVSHCTFTEAVSFIVHCETQEELDRMWEQLSAGGEAGQCGWLKDQYGLSWQIVPTVLPAMLSDPNPARAERVLRAVMRMKKLDIHELEEAFGPQ
jgi:predicted 3-demethylubiquinone-9 3-methyltransferase (glyoxalase superfamily)